jgi:hypothetical protein
VVIWGWRKLHSGELNDLYLSQNIIRGVQIKKSDMDLTRGYIQEKKYACKIFGGKPEAKKLPGRFRHKWNNIKRDPKSKMEACGMDASASE